HEMNCDDQWCELTYYHTAAEPTLKSGKQQGRNRGPQDLRLSTIVTPRGDNRSENQKTNRHAEHAVEVLGPHQGRIEERRIKLRRKLRRRCGRNPESKASRPVGTA